MKQGHIFKTEIGGREVIVETGKYGEQANGHCIVPVTSNLLCAPPNVGV